jgi:hypothetical protein
MQGLAAMNYHYPIDTVGGLVRRHPFGEVARTINPVVEGWM